MLYVCRRERHLDDEGLDNNYDEEVHVLRWEEQGWATTDSGGSSWIDPFSVSTDELRREVVVPTGISGERLDGSGDWFFTVGGLCSADAKCVEVLQRGERRRYGIDTPMHAFVLGVYVPPHAVVHLLEESGDPMSRDGNVPVEWTIRHQDGTHDFPGDHS